MEDANKQHRRTKILVTVGPSTSDESTLRRLLEAGVNGFRFNFSHGSIDDFKPILKRIRKITSEFNRNVTCLADLQGPKIRVGKLDSQPLILENEEIVVVHPPDVTSDNLPDNSIHVPITHANLASDFSTGSLIHLNEGKVRLEVVEQKEDYIKARVREEGKIWNDNGVNVPDTEFSVPAMTDKDRRDLRGIVEEDFDMIALSFVRKASDLDEAREKIQEVDQPLDLLAKIESSKALRNLDEIISSVEGIIVARGDLGVEIGPERVPFQQKRMIRKANRRGRIVITATQMLETMIENPVPTRAEVSDVANAVLDVSDVVMLSGETAVGQYPIKTTETMNNIITTTETDFRDQLVELSPDLDRNEVKIGATMSNAAARVANDVDAKAIVAPTSSGFTARMVSKTYPICPIVALSYNDRTLQKSSLYRNVKPYPLEKISKTERLIEESKTIVRELNLAVEGDKIILLTGLPLERGGITNLLHVIEIRD